MDVKRAHGEWNEKVFMKQPEGFVEKGKENKVCLLNKSLYGLKQSLYILLGPYVDREFVLP